LISKLHNRKCKTTYVLNIKGNAGLMTNRDTATTNNDVNEAGIQILDLHYAPSTIISTTSTTTHMKKQSIVEVRKPLIVSSVVANDQQQRAV